AVEALLAAGDRAWGLGAAAAALTHYERVLGIEPGQAEDGHLLYRMGRARLIVSGEGAVELGRAAELLRESDPAVSASAEVAHGESIWHRGDRDGSFPHFERALAAVEELPPSREKATVLGHVARFTYLAGRPRPALQLLGEAIQMAED